MKRFAIALLFLATPALAQQQPDPAAMQKAIAVLQGQRNQALDREATAAVQAAALAEENEKLKSEIAELKKRAEAAAPKKP